MCADISKMGEFKHYNELADDWDIEKIDTYIGNVSMEKKNSADSLYRYVLAQAYKHENDENFISFILEIIGNGEPDVIMEFLGMYSKDKIVRIELSDFILEIRPEIIKPAINVFLDYLRIALSDYEINDDELIDNFIMSRYEETYNNFLKYFKDHKNDIKPDKVEIKNKEKIDPNIRPELETMNTLHSNVMCS